MQGEEATDRKVIRLTGDDRMEFLQGMVTNDVSRLAAGPVYAALLTPQGKYLADFLLVSMDDAILIDAKADQAPALLKRLSMYKLRAKVDLAETDLHVHRGLGTPEGDAVTDPRHPALGWRAYRSEAGGAPTIDWDAIRVEHAIPEAGVELVPDDSFILEMGFERLNGVDFRKGCYVGQEVTARMKHKTELRKGLARVSVAGAAPPGTPILAGEKPAGTLFTQSGGAGLAYLRFDRAEGEMRAGDARLKLAEKATD